MVQQLRVFTTQSEDQISDPSTHIRKITRAFSSSSKGSNTLAFIGTDTYTEIHIHTERQIKKNTIV